MGAWLNKIMLNNKHLICINYLKRIKYIFNESSDELKAM